MTILADIGEGITLISQTKSYDIYGTPTITGSTVNNVTGYVTLLSSDDNEVKTGILNLGDARGYFKPSDESSLKAGYVVEYQSKQYEIVGEPRKYSIGGTAYHLEVNLKRLDKP